MSCTNTTTPSKLQSANYNGGHSNNIHGYGSRRACPHVLWAPLSPRRCHFRIQHMQENQEPALCEDVLSCDEHSTQASTVHELASIALEIATAIAKFNSKNFGVGARYNQGTPVGDALLACLMTYGDAIDNLEVLAKHSLHVGDYADALRKVLDAKAAGDVCDNALKRIKEDFVVESDRKMTERCGVTGELIGLFIHK
ncbi:uncharacterized protein [Aegilops tauschii subsp. strangulata]|uniref:Pectinesterase inhibitor domain-containing protein n=1 Tax=Aegilops tauschii TaxID=37682 RepID=R7WBH7_AEGTA